MAMLEQPFPTLEGHRFVNLITYRKSGDAVPTPVWFAIHKGALYVFTGVNSGKVKRIRNNPHVQLQPCDHSGKPLGPATVARARLLSAEESVRGRVALNAKYGVQKAAYEIMLTFQGRASEIAYLEVVPT
jgi:hypothetical protein